MIRMYFHPKFFYLFWKDVLSRRALVCDLAKKDFRTRFLGSYLGIIWAFIQPCLNILILWFVFQVGFKTASVKNFPFILWLMTGMIPWFFFAESLTAATTSILDQSYLVKKVVFKVSVLPVVKIVSSLFVHLFFIVFIVVLFGIYGYWPTVHNLQVIYYLLAMILFVWGLSFTTSSLIIFVRDVGQLVGLMLQFGFWLTPIFWPLDMVPAQYAFWLRFNPVYYLTEGYRNCFLHKAWFWEDPWLTLYFWSVTCFIWFIGAIIFRRLRPHFADVL